MGPRGRLRDEQGFTLVELLITMVIVGIMILAVGGAVVVLLRDNGALSDRVALAHDQELLAAYVVPDVQSALTVSSSTAGSGCSSGANLLTMSWSETLASTTNYSSVYKVVSVGGQWQITRTLSVNGVAQAPQTVTHGLTSSSSATTTCSGASSRSVKMQITEQAGTASVTAVRRGP